MTATKDRVIVALDFETTGTDVFEDRIVTATITELETSGEVRYNYEWLVDPGIPIPAEATAVHGITTEMVQSVGYEAKEAVSEIVHLLSLYPENTPLVIMNANYDISLLYYEALRYGVQPLDHERFNIIDPLVLDRHFDKYRPGSRKLVALAEHYGVPVDEDLAHNSTYDNYLAGNVAIKIVQKEAVTNSMLENQALWYKEWAQGLQEYLRRTNPEAVVDSEWPLRRG